MDNENPPFDLTEAAKLLSLLGNDIRLRLLIELSNREWSVNELSDYLKLERPLASHYLGQLRRAEVVTTRRTGQMIYYSCRSKAVRKMIAVMKGFDWTKQS